MLNIIVVLESSDQKLLTTSCNYFMFLSISYKWSMDVSNMALYNIHILSLLFFHLLLTSLNYTVVYVSMSTPLQDQRRLRQRWSTSRAPSEATLHHQPQPAFQPQHGSSAPPSTQRPPHAPTQWPTPPVQPPGGTAALSPRRHGAGPPVQRRLQT